MEDNNRFDFVVEEIEAIYEDFDVTVTQLILIRALIKDLIKVTKGENPSYNLSKIKK